MACYYKINEADEALPIFKGFHLQKVMKFKGSGPKINYDFSKHVLIELLDDSTPESKLWSELGLTNNKNVVHKRIMIDSHRVKCRRAVVVCVNSEEAKQLAQRISQTKIMKRCVCAVVIQDLLSDLCLFEKQIIQFGDIRPQQQLLYVSDLNRCREPSGLVRFLKEKFSPFGTILSVLVCPDDDGYAYPEGVIKFAYLSEAFAAELALDQYVLGKERLSVTTHHNILLSQCDLRVRLRNAQWCNNAEPNTFSESIFDSYELNDLSTFDDDPVVDSINNLHISSQDISIINTDSALHNNASVSNMKDIQYLMNIQCEKSNSDYSRESHVDGIVYSKEKSNSLPLSGCGKNIVYNVNNTKASVKEKTFNRSRLPNKKINNLLIMPNDMTVTHYKNPANALSKDQFDLERKLNPLTSRGSRITKGSNISDSCSFVSHGYGSDSRAHSSLFPAKNTILERESFHAVDLSALSISSDCKQLSSVHNDSENRGKLATGNSKKRRKHFTSSQKLCLKSQRIGLSENATPSTNAKSETSYSGTSESGKSESSKVVYRKNLGLNHVTSKGLSSLPEDPVPSKVTNWLAHLPISQRSVTGGKKHKNRISVHNTPSLKSKTIGRNGNEIYSDNSSVENEDPNENAVILSNEDWAVLQTDKFRSPLQAWLKQELVSSANNTVIKSQETSESIIVCAAKTKDVIISVGCSHMTCNICYPSSTDLLLGYS